MSPPKWILIGTVSGAVFVAFLLWYWIRKRQIRIIGPMFWYELVRLARRGQQPRLRVLLVSLLLVGLFVTYLREFQGEELTALSGSSQLKLDRSARFAETFLITFLSAQMLAVILITPAMVGSSITEEKERGTLDFLQSSLLSNHEIILGKFTSRLTYVGGVLLAGVPVLALTSMFGGVDFTVLLAGYVVTVMSALSLGAFSLWLGVTRDSLRDVLFWVYSAVLILSVFGTCCGCIPGISALSPPTALGYLFIQQLATPDSALFWVHFGIVITLHGTATILFTILAIQAIRTAPPRRLDPRRYRSDRSRRRERTRSLPIARRVNGAEKTTQPEQENTPRGSHQKVIIVNERKREDFDDEEDEEDFDFRRSNPRPRARRSFQPERLKDGNPYFWKERYFTGSWSWFESGAMKGFGIAALTIVGFILGMTLFFSLISELNKGHWAGEAVNPIARIVLTFGTMLIGLRMGLRTAISVAWERQKQTLDALLTIPENRSILLQAKWLTAVHCNRWGIIVLGISGVLSIITVGLHPVGFVVAMVQMTGWLVFSNTLGLWVSVCCKTVTRATVFYLIWTISFWLVPLMFAPLGTVIGQEFGELTLMMSMPIGVWQSALSWGDFSEEHYRNSMLLWINLAVAVISGLTYWLLSLIMWLDANRRFQKEGM